MLKLQELEAEKVKLKRDPYAYVRTVVMRSLLFKRDDYYKMLKMGFGEIARFMQDSSYRKEINELAGKYSGADLLELALNRNLAASFSKLMRVSSFELGLLIREYAKRKDIEDIKTILRGKFTNADEKIILNSLTAAGTLSYGYLESLLKKESVEQILREVEIFDSATLKRLISRFNEKNSLSEIENELDKKYYSHLIIFSQSLPKEGKLFRNFLLKEAETINMLTLFRLKKAKLKKEDIKNFLIPYGEKKRDAKLAELADAEGIEQLSQSFTKTEYRDIVAKGAEEYKKSGSLIKLETDIYNHLLRQSTLLLHQHPLSIDTILGYMFAKDIEVRNLKIIIKGKQLGLSEQFIESQLVFE